MVDGRGRASKSDGRTDGQTDRGDPQETGGWAGDESFSIRAPFPTHFFPPRGIQLPLPSSSPSSVPAENAWLADFPLPSPASLALQGSKVLRVPSYLPLSWQEVETGERQICPGNTERYQILPLRLVPLKRHGCETTASSFPL